MPQHVCVSESPLTVHGFMYLAIFCCMSAGKAMADIPKDILEDACQLVKANSIQVGKWRGCCGWACCSRCCLGRCFWD
jgi:hypothetical protein